MIATFHRCYHALYIIERAGNQNVSLWLWFLLAGRLIFSNLYISPTLDSSLTSRDNRCLGCCFSPSVSTVSEPELSINSWSLQGTMDVSSGTSEVGSTTKFPFHQRRAICSAGIVLRMVFHPLNFSYSEWWTTWPIYILVLVSNMTFLEERIWFYSDCNKCWKLHSHLWALLK